MTFLACLLLAAADPPVAALVADLNADSPAKRVAAAKALRPFPAHAPAAVEALSKLLADKDANVAWSALDVLGTYGTAAKPAVPALLELGKARPRDINV